MVASDGFLIDISPPVAGTVALLSAARVTTTLTPNGVDPDRLATAYDDATRATAQFVATRSELPEYQASLLPLHLSWQGFRDPETAVVDFAVCIGSEPGQDDVRQCVSVGMDTYAFIGAGDAMTNSTAMARASNITSVKIAHVTIRATNGAGWTSFAATAVAVDETAPIAGAVKGLTDAGYVNTIDALAFTMEGVDWRSSW